MTILNTPLPAADPTTQDQHESPGSDDPDPSRSLPVDTQGDPAIYIDLILNIDSPDDLPAGWLDDQFARAVALEGITHARLNLVIVGDEEMAQLHEQYTGVAGTTDVLTFDLAEDGGSNAPPSSGTLIEGDIVLCIDEARRQAADRAHPAHHELLLYAVHGLMHLLGEDDHDEEDYQRMHAREDALLEKLGIGRLFNPKT